MLDLNTACLNRRASTIARNATAGNAPALTKARAAYRASFPSEAARIAHYRALAIKSASARAIRAAEAKARKATLAAKIAALAANGGPRDADATLALAEVLSAYNAL